MMNFLCEVLAHFAWNCRKCRWQFRIESGGHLKCLLLLERAGEQCVVGYRMPLYCFVLSAPVDNVRKQRPWKVAYSVSKLDWSKSCVSLLLTLFPRWFHSLQQTLKFERLCEEQCKTVTDISQSQSHDIRSIFSPAREDDNMLQLNLFTALIHGAGDEILFRDQHQSITAMIATTCNSASSF